jgi:hypothetical protein
VLDRELLAQYSVVPEWQGFATRTLVRNFKPKKMIDLLGGRTSLDRVPELTAYPGAQSDSREYAIQVAKFGRQFGFSWEAMINDDLDQLMQIPNTFGQAAALTETENALSVIANLTTGAANTAFFKDYSAVTGYVGSGLNTTPVAGVLNQANLQTAIEAIRQRKDNEGNIVPAGRLILVVGPAQEFNARSILNATEIRTTVGSKVIIEPNPLAGAVDLVVVNRLPGLGWFVLPSPTRRPARGRVGVPPRVRDPRHPPEGRCRSGPEPRRRGLRRRLGALPRASRERCGDRRPDPHLRGHRRLIHLADGRARVIGPARRHPHRTPPLTSDGGSAMADPVDVGPAPPQRRRRPVGLHRRRDPAFLDLEGGNVKLAAAQAIDTNADNEALASKVLRTQDLSTDGAKVADALRKRAAALREQVLAEDDGYFDIVDLGPSCGPELTGRWRYW